MVHATPHPAGAGSRTWRTVRRLSLMLAAASIGRPAQAQVRAGAVVGVVRDELGNGIPGVTVVLDSAAIVRHASTDSLGRFTLAGIDSGTHLLRALRIGFSPAERLLHVPARGAFVELTMTRLTVLDTIPIRAERSGVFGKVVGRAGFEPIAGATVTVIGSRQVSGTDRAGGFNLPDVQPGSYLVRVQRRGFESRMLSVVVPERGAVELAVALEEATGPDREQRMAGLLREADTRARMRGTTSAVVPRQELAGRYEMPLGRALRYSASFLLSGLVIDDSVTCVFVDGLPAPGRILDDFGAGDVVTIEVYGLRQDHSSTLADRWPRGARCGWGDRDAPEGSAKFGLQGSGGASSRVPMDNRARAVVIWTRDPPGPERPR